MNVRFLVAAGKLALIGAVLASGIALMPAANAKNDASGKKQGSVHAQNTKGWQKNKHNTDISSNSAWRTSQDRDRFRDWLDGVSSRRYGSTYNVSDRVLRRNNITRAEFAALPPGIQKNVMRGKSIPPGLQPGHRLERSALGRVTPISESILDTLGLPRDRYRYSDGRRVGRYGDDAIIYNPTSGIIFDVLSGIFN